jgi:RHS repeat-associated protein
MKHLAIRVLLLICMMVPALGMAATTITYYHNDLVGSPVVATNEAGAVVWRESYRPYGERLRNETNSAPNDVWFTSRRQDVETGLVYMGARYYDPAVGRFLSMDPAGFDESNIHSFNRYAYGNNNPYRYVDPNGRWAVAAGLITGGVLAIGGGYSVLSDDQRLALVRSLGQIGQYTLIGQLGGLITDIIASESNDHASGGDKGSTLRPGPNAGESIPARGPGRDFTPGEREAINEIGDRTGCHTCGATDPGTKSGNWVPDHQRPSRLNPDGDPQRLYPQCLNCSRTQGGQVRGATSGD